VFIDIDLTNRLRRNEICGGFEPKGGRVRVWFVVNL
jgi:hypothetical protein